MWELDLSIDTGSLYLHPSHGADDQKGQGNERSILGVCVQTHSRSETISQINQLLQSGGHAKFAFLNAHSANLAHEDDVYRKSLQEFSILADGVGVDIASSLLYGQKFPDNLNGTDFIPQLLTSIQKPLKVVLLGARPGVADQAAKNMSRAFPKHNFSVVSHGYFDHAEQLEIIDKLISDRPDILLVAMGNPNQEQWIVENCNKEIVGIAFAVGAFFDFFAELVPRAPQWVRRIRLEWIHRLVMDPGRLWRRYILGNPLFIWRVLKQKMLNSPKNPQKLDWTA